MSHNSGYRPIAHSPAKEGESTWSDHGIDLTPPITTSGRLHVIAQEIAILEERLQVAVELLKRARSEFLQTEPTFSDELDDEMVAFINTNTTIKQVAR